MGSLPPRTDFRIIPAFPLAIWFAAGVAIGLVVCGVWRGTAGLVFAATAPLALAGLSTWPVTRRGMVGLAIGGILAVLHEARVSGGYGELLPRDAAGAVIEAVIVEPVARSETAAPLPAPWQFVAKVRRIRVGGCWWPSSGKTVLQSRKPLPLLAYGDCIRADGAFVPANQARSIGGFDYRQYLASRGVSHRFKVADIATQGRAGGWYALAARVYRFRDRFVALETRGMESENASLLAAFTAGYRYGLSSGTAQTFLRSGTIHVFAISGLHTGIVAGILSGVLLLVRVPYRARHLLVPIVLGVYVFATGAAPSATRAWLMISLYCWARVLSRPIHPLQAVSLAALVLLAWNPLNIMRTGFQFSFVIVGFLLVGWHRLMPYVRSLFEKDYWRPMAYRMPFWWTVRLRQAALLLCAGTMAWMGSAGLVLVVNGLFIPATVPVNAGISLLLFPAFIAGFAKALCAAVGAAWIDGMLAGLLDAMVGAIRSLAVAGSRPPASMSVWQGGMGVGLAYYACALAYLVPKAPRAVRRIAVAGVVLLVGGLLAWPRVLPARTTVFHGAGLRTPAAVLFPDDGLPAVLINTGGYPWARQIRSYLRHRGCSRLSALVIARGTTDCFYRAETVVRTYRPATLWLPADRTSPVNRAALERIAATQRRAGGRVRWFDSAGADEQGTPRLGDAPLVDVRLEERDRSRRIAVEYGSAGRQCLLSLVQRSEGPSAVAFRTASRPQKRLRIPLTLEPAVTTLWASKKTAETRLSSAPSSFTWRVSDRRPVGRLFARRVSGCRQSPGVTRKPARRFSVEGVVPEKKPGADARR